MPLVSGTLQGGVSLFLVSGGAPNIGKNGRDTFCPRMEGVMKKNSRSEKNSSYFGGTRNLLERQGNGF